MTTDELTVENAPEARGAFVGRDDDLDHLLDLLRDDGARVTVTGPPGVGKTRLAVECAGRAAAGELSDLQEVVWISCRDVVTPEELLGRVSLELDPDRELPGTVERAVDRLAEELDRTPALYVFDNLEQTAQSTRQIFETWSRNCRRLRMLATARVALQFDGEETFDLTPLPSEVSHRLYVERAEERCELDASRLQGDDQVDQLVERLGGNPLMIELSAVQADVLSPEKCLERLDEPLKILRSPAGSESTWESTLEKSIARSWEQLAPAERLGLSELTVFENGATLDAAEAVLDTEHASPSLSIPHLLQNLRSRSLVRRRGQVGSGRERFELYVPVEAFAKRAREEVVDLEDLRRRHAEYYLRRCEDMLVDLRDSAGEVDWDWVGAELGNLAQAFDWALQHRPGLAVDVFEVLISYSHTRWFPNEFSSNLEARYEDLLESLEASDEDVTSERELRARRRRWEIAVDRQSAPAGELVERFVETADRAEELDHPRPAMSALARAAYLEQSRGAYRAARGHVERLVDLAESNDEHRGVAVGLAQLAHCAFQLGHYQQARETFQRAERNLDAVSLDWNATQMYGDWVEMELAAGRVDEASRLAERGLQQMDDPESHAAASILSARSQVRLVRDEVERAHDDASRAVEMMEKLRRLWNPFRALELPRYRYRVGIVCLANGDLEEALETFERAERRARTGGASEVRRKASLWMAVARARASAPRSPDDEFDRLDETARDSPMAQIARAERACSRALEAEERGEMRAATDRVARARWQGLSDWPGRGTQDVVVARHLFEARLDASDVSGIAAAEVADLVVDTGPATWFQAKGEEAVDLSSTNSMRRILTGLVDEHLTAEQEGLAVDDLKRLGWPDEDPEEVPRSRVYNTISRLRERGLEEWLESGDGGYHLASDAVILVRPQPLGG